MKHYRHKIFTTIIEENINKQILKPGDKLPSARSIKQEYKLSTSTVQSGYDYLVFKGLVTSLPRSGYVVAVQNNAETAADVYPDLPPIPRDPVFQNNISLTSSLQNHSEYTSFNVAVPSDTFVPQKLVLRTMQEVIREKGAALLRYYPANGSAELRELLSRRSAAHGAIIQPEELLITDGAIQALYIALATVTIPGDIIAVESPCVFSILETIANLRLKTIEIPVRYKDGFDTDYLRNVCDKNQIKAIVLTPNFQNPTGILLSDEKKKKVLEIATQHQIPIIENDIYGDLYFNDSRPSTIRNFDTTGLVITYSSFSKTIAPGIRLGWLAAGRYYSEAERIKFSLGRSVTPLNQEVVIKLLSSTSYDRHLRSFRRQLEHQSITLLNQFKKHFPKQAYAHAPLGGYSIWIQLPPLVDMELFYAKCEQFRILFTPVSTFSYTNSYSHHYRMIFSQRITDTSLEAIKKIGNFLKP
ncbi:PLP-dependent aminotransferase family protein [Pedobacter foliorum]|uniref:aminotransferase-like domain-containing protein n=1 Tax=Pedobacter foliorum TaxID=2739058 RepID=UPI0015669AA8|nr:PLP-dependent aminotransferase family protein [Pedobacter foliorum]NRF38179.1 PLP-dependent aminotransferase family protein [Pedobacter foliorum]